MSASPAPLDTGAEDPKKITFRFCSECSNLLYPKEDKQNHKLMFSCRTCQYSMPAPSACVARHEVTSTVGDTAGITQDVAQDPTVGSPDFDTPEHIPGFCTMCGQEIFCEICGQETDGGLFLEVVDEQFLDDDDEHDYDDHMSYGSTDIGMITPGPPTPNDFFRSHSPQPQEYQFQQPSSSGPQLKEGEVTNGHHT